MSAYAVSTMKGYRRRVKDRTRANIDRLLKHRQRYMTPISFLACTLLVMHCVFT